MLRLIILFAFSMCLAYCSQKEVLVFPVTKKFKLDIPLIIMVLVMGISCGLRTDYNDTSLYIAAFRKSVSVSKYINSFDLFDNPLYHIIESYFRHHVSENPHVFLITLATFCYGCVLRFIRKHSENFLLSMVLFFSLGLFISHYASVKQCLAMAVLTFALDALINKKFLLYFLFLFIAFLFHTYAIVFIVVPFFYFKPWTLPTFFAVGVVLFTLLTFENVLTSVLSVSDEVGKNLNEAAFKESTTINPIRLTVFSILPALTFLFQDNLTDIYDRPKIIFANLGILSFLSMAMGLYGAANLFGRVALYFQIGIVIIMPSILKEIFDEESQTFVNILVSICYLSFFFYSVKDFPTEFKSIGLGEFFINIFGSII